MIHVTDHAVLRYLERVCRIDVERARETIKAQVAHGVVVAEGRMGTTGKYGVRGMHCRFIVQNGAVVTCLENRMAHTLEDDA